MIYLGENPLNHIYLGSKPDPDIYLGDRLVWPRGAISYLLSNVRVSYNPASPAWILANGSNSAQILATVKTYRNGVEISTTNDVPLTPVRVNAPNNIWTISNTTITAINRHTEDGSTRYGYFYGKYGDASTNDVSVQQQYNIITKSYVLHSIVPVLVETDVHDEQEVIYVDEYTISHGNDQYPSASIVLYPEVAQSYATTNEYTSGDSSYVGIQDASYYNPETGQIETDWDWIDGPTSIRIDSPVSWLHLDGTSLYADFNSTSQNRICPITLSYTDTDSGITVDVSVNVKQWRNSYQISDGYVPYNFSVPDFEWDQDYDYFGNDEDEYENYCEISTTIYHDVVKWVDGSERTTTHTQYTYSSSRNNNIYVELLGEDASQYGVDLSQYAGDTIDDAHFYFIDPDDLDNEGYSMPLWWNSSDGTHTNSPRVYIVPDEPNETNKDIVAFVALHFVIRENGSIIQDVIGIEPVIHKKQ